MAADPHAAKRSSAIPAEVTRILLFDPSMAMLCQHRADALCSGSTHLVPREGEILAFVGVSELQPRRVVLSAGLPGEQQAGWGGSPAGRVL